MREQNEDLVINSFDDNNDDYINYNEDEYILKEKNLTINEITDKQLNIFIKENSESIKHIKNIYSDNILNDEVLLTIFKDNLFNLKDKFNIILIDTYNEHIKISRIFKEESYLRYGNKKLNEWLQLKVFKV